MCLQNFLVGWKNTIEVIIFMMIGFFCFTLQAADSLAFNILNLKNGAIRT